jgi:hypothetical protein
MSEAPTLVFSSEAFLPHGYCLLWTPALLWLWIGSDALISRRRRPLLTHC